MGHLAQIEELIITVRVQLGLLERTARQVCHTAFIVILFWFFEMVVVVDLYERGMPGSQKSFLLLKVHSIKSSGWIGLN